MIIDILGCSGGIGSGLKTTSFLVDRCLLVDAGSGVEQLTPQQMLCIRHVLITHAHLDHIFGLPLMLATIYDQHQAPVHVYARQEVLKALKDHIFNGVVWPDFTVLPGQQPIVQLHRIEDGDELVIGRYSVEALPAEHPSPALGYYLSDGKHSFAFSGDSTFHRPFWQAVERLKPEHLIVDISFTDGSEALAKSSGHMTPGDLPKGLALLGYRPQVYLTHLKPGHEQLIASQAAALQSGQVWQLYTGQRLEFS